MNSGTIITGANGKVDTQVYGTFTTHTIHPEPPPDPLNGLYLLVPEPKGTVEITFPLLSFRDKVFTDKPGESLERGRDFLQKHGFSAFHHTATLKDLSKLKDSEHIRSSYYSELQDLVKSVTGCKKVFATSSVMRESYTNPRNVSDNHSSSRTMEENDRKDDDQSQNPLKNHVDLQVLEETGKHQEELGNIRPHHLPAIISPSRIPHMDYTPLGARQLIRSMRSDIFHYASTETGIIAHEDAICASGGEGISAVEANSDAVISRHYNQPHTLGPRYGIFSIWRPLKTCTRDPLAFVQKQEFDLEIERAEGDLEMWRYDLRTPGFKGDWLWNLAMLRAKKPDPQAAVTTSNKSSLKWYYLPDQQPDEVLFIKHFDSAALGETALEAPGVLHGSPSLGDAGYGDPRESIEIRVIAFW